MGFPPGSTIGIIGGGQLARMLAMAAARLGLRTVILEPDKNCPAAQVTNDHLIYDYNDEIGLAELADATDVITYEFENVPVTAAQFLESRTELHPRSRALEISQDRLVEKNFINNIGIATARYANIENVKDFKAALVEFGGTGILKTRRLGYDGKGQVRFNGEDEASIETIFAEFGNVPCIIEEMVAFEREISVVAARGISGSFVSFDPAWNIHRDGILRQSIVPCGLSEKIMETAGKIAEQIMNELSYVGIMGTEFFVTGAGELLVNEIAPRVHNSGHWTEAACAISQFEQHVRAVVGWPLQDASRHSDCIMENIIGDEIDNIHTAENDGAIVLHLYGKSDVRPGRKMGHLTRLSSLLQ
jgi:5-(carboxyamino)imidazole ribonucleotide synthase